MCYSNFKHDDTGLFQKVTEVIGLLLDYVSKNFSR